VVIEDIVNNNVEQNENFYLKGMRRNWILSIFSNFLCIFHKWV